MGNEINYFGAGLILIAILFGTYIVLLNLTMPKAFYTGSVIIGGDVEVALRCDPTNTNLITENSQLSCVLVVSTTRENITKVGITINMIDTFDNKTVTTCYARDTFIVNKTASSSQVCISTLDESLASSRELFNKGVGTYRFEGREITVATDNVDVPCEDVNFSKRLTVLSSNDETSAARDTGSFVVAILALLIGMIALFISVIKFCTYEIVVPTKKSKK